MRGYRAPRAFDGERVLPDGALVLVDDGRILAVEPASAPAPADCPVTELPGATLLPGLVDAHVHLCGDGGPHALDHFPELSDAELDAIVGRSMAEQLAGGVTAVRDLGDARWAVLDRHRGRDDGPTVVASGPPITCPDGHCAGMGGEAAGEQGLRRAVRERAEHGADVVKIMTSGGLMTAGTDVLATQYTLDELRAVVDEAHDAGLQVTAHAHAATAIEMCVAAGVDGIEHGTSVTAEGIRNPPGLADAIATAGIPVCPTLARRRDVLPLPHVQEAMERAHMAWEDRYEQIAELHRAGVVLVGGVDAGINPAKTHGLMSESLIDLGVSGLSAVEALAAGTGVAARVCGLGGRTGRLAPGLDADLLAVAGDPLADLAALREVRLVVSRGREVVPG